MTKKTRLLLFVLTILLLASSVFSFVFLDNNFLIRKWNIPLSPPGFLDSRQLAWAAESYALGYDPLVENPVNWRGHQLNYPRIWQLVFALDIDRNHTNIIGSIVVVLFFIGLGIFWFSKKYDPLTCFFLLIASISSAVMLGVERSNIELIVFFVLALALFVNYSSSLRGLFLFLFAAILKIYPIFGLVYLLKENRERFWKFFLSGAAFFIVYLLLTAADTARVYNTTPQLPGSSMGMNVWWLGLNNRRFFNLHLSDDIILYCRVLTYAVTFMTVLLTAFFSMKQKYRGFTQGEHLDAFRVGAAIYIGCFVMIINADYRLIFLIFTIPQLVSWLRVNGQKLNPVPLITLCATIITLWSSFIMHFLGRNPTFIIEESCNWIIFGGFLYLLFASLPDWFSSYLQRPFSRVTHSRN